MSLWRQFLFVVALVSISGATTLFGQSQPLSDRVVAYQIDATYHPANHSLDATETLTYTNKTGQPLDTFPFHLYLNAFQPKSTFMREDQISGTRDLGSGFRWKSEYFGEDKVKSFVVEGMGDLTSQIQFIAPDDGNPDDRTVFQVKLPKPIPPNGTVTFKIAFHDQFPQVVARSGYKRDFILGGQWFPKVGVWWHGAWNCHQYHNTTEFFADFGTYDVNLTLPSNFNVGATGVQTAEKANSDGTKTLTFHAQDVIDFAWTADPHTKIVESEVNLSTGPVKIRMLMQPGHMASAPRYLQALKGTMKLFDEWYGPYPYPQITVVDPPHGGGAAGGMEYPTFITADTTWWMSKAILEPEVVVAHEYGHQYWYAMVATNEFEDAWLDEGINSYSEVKVMSALYGRNTSTINSRIGTVGDGSVQRLSYLSAADLDPISRKAWQFASYGSYGGVTYGKTATMLRTLQHFIGKDTVQKALRVYFMKYRFQHPDGQDFMNTVSQVAGQNLDWYWSQAVNGTQILDYGILSAESLPTDWYEKNPPPEKKGVTMYRDYVTVHRLGDFILPVTLQVKFDDGETIRAQWDGQDRWHRFVWEKKAKLVSAEIDPDHAIYLDRDRFNNSWTAKPNTRATQKVSFYLMYMKQWLAMAIAWLA